MTWWRTSSQDLGWNTDFGIANDSIKTFYSKSMLKFYLFEWFQVWTALVVWISRYWWKGQNCSWRWSCQGADLFWRNIDMLLFSKTGKTFWAIELLSLSKLARERPCCRCSDRHTVGLLKLETSLACWSQWSPQILRPNQRPLPFGLSGHFRPSLVIDLLDSILCWTWQSGNQDSFHEGKYSVILHDYAQDVGGECPALVSWAQKIFYLPWKDTWLILPVAYACLKD